MRIGGVALLAVLLLGAACESSEKSASPSPSAATSSAPAPTPAASSSPTPTRPAKPPVRAGRLEGEYTVKYTLLASDVPGSARVEQNRWRLSARCREGGSCNARLESLNNEWKATAIWRRGEYRWARSIRHAYTCGPGDDVDYYIDATYQYVIEGDRVRWNGEDWVITAFSGTFVSKGLRGCGLSGPPEERYAISGRLS